VQLLENESDFWREIQKRREGQQQYLKNSLTALKNIITPEARAELYEITRALCHRNNLALSKIIRQ